MTASSTLNQSDRHRTIARALSISSTGKGWLAKAEATQPMGQLVKPHQVAGLAAYLLSPESGVMTGALIDYDQRVSGADPE
jgi:NAD(P)-dependent dehydrogenase (short-subunit alcohol dehydrogenase family)